MPARFPKPMDETFDPLSFLMAPPADETPEERQRRILEEQEAKRISDAIDAAIKEEEKRAKKAKPKKVLLLGQSESGKSTTLKNFQLASSPTAFQEDRMSWRLVIQLNIVRSIRIILEVLQWSQEHPSDPDAPYKAPDGLLTTDHKVLRLRLAPILTVEDYLMRLLSPFNQEEATRLDTAWGERAQLGPRKEPIVRSGGDWKKKLSMGKAKGRAAHPEVEHDHSRVIYECRRDIMNLWRDPAVQSVLAANNIRLQEMGGFYLDDLERVTALDWVPSIEDVLKARLKTIGVSEWKLNLIGDASSPWHVYDVGGTRAQRHTWIPFFDGVDAIIFLAPVNCFDQSLVEDRSVNRMEDTLILFKTVCKSELLAKVTLILFLNKVDLLPEKLATVRLKDWMGSFGDRPNEPETVCKYFKSKFRAIHKEHSRDEGRRLYIHLTSATETESMASIIKDVRDEIMRVNIEASGLV